MKLPTLWQWVWIGVFVWVLQSAGVDVPQFVSGVLGGIGTLFGAILHGGFDALLGPIGSGSGT